MSTSGLIAARKRLENAIKKYNIPTEAEPKESDQCKDGVLLLSLLQSRLNWINSTFARYKTDHLQQPKRTSNTRRKWPNMKYLGTCTLQLGAHIFENSKFYEATRTDSWRELAKKQGLVKEDPKKKTPKLKSKKSKTKADKNADNNTSSTDAQVEAESTITTPEIAEVQPVSSESQLQPQPQPQPAASEQPAPTSEQQQQPSQTTAEVETVTAEQQQQLIAPATETSSTQAPSDTQLTQPVAEPMEEVEIPDELLTFVDVVFEIEELPNERFIFPKDAIIQVIPTSPTEQLVLASFVLPLDLAQTEEFFQKPKEKILKYGENCQLPYIQEFYRENTSSDAQASETPPPSNKESYQPVNIQMSNATGTMSEVLTNYVHKPDVVKKAMKEKMKFFPKRTFLKYDLDEEDSRRREIQELVKRASVAPDISTGPVQAEKKRNEILNAIRLGKRERDEKFESELPKTKLNARDDGFMKCAYCSTKHTSMWRPGPGGHGTLCNSCGIQWKRGEILVGAPVISIEEERRLLREKKEREKIAEALELERAEKEEKKQQKKAERHTGSHSYHNGPFTIGPFAVQLMHQKHRQQNKANHIPSSAPIPSSKKSIQPKNNDASPSTSTDIYECNAVTHSHVPPMAPTQPQLQPQLPMQPQQPVQQPQSQPLPQQSQNQQPQKQTSQSQPLPLPQSQPVPVPLALYSPAGIPLPTLSIDFVGFMQFAHPNCGVTLLDRFFSVRLFKDASLHTTIEIDKKDLANAEFEVVTEGEAPLQREILKMKVSPIPKAIEVFGKTLAADDNSSINLRFLEKLDPSGGAVVKRIIQRWMVTVPQPTQ